MINRTKKHQYNIDKIINKINKYEYISFDIFDTLVKRNVEKPSDIFNLVEVEYNKQNNKKIKNFKQLRIQAEIKAKEIIDGNEPNIDDIYEMLEIDGDKNQIKELELETELKFIQKNKDFDEIYKYCKNNGKKIIIVSDMYLNKKFIEMILKDNGIDQYEKLFISNDIKLNKHSGSIFPFILKKLKISRKNIIHIGDSKRGDYIMPMLHGIKSILIPKKLRKTKYCNDEKIKKSLDYNVLETFINNNIPYEEDIYFKIGYETLGPILYGYTKWLISQLKEKNIGKIFFLAREGNLLKRSFDIINEEKIESKYLYVSRRSTRTPLLKNINNMNDIFDIVKMRNVTTIEDFFKNVGLEVYKYNSKLKKYGLMRQDNIKNNDKFNVLFEEIKEDIIQNALNEEKNLLGYLNKEGVSGRIAVSDVGWVGTMQKSLEHILIEKNIKHDITGFYMGQSPKAKEYIMKGMQTQTYLFDYSSKRYNEEFRFFLNLFESFFLAQHGTTLMYSNKEDGFMPILDESEYSREESEIFKNIQDAAIYFIKEYRKLDINFSAESSFEGFKTIGLKPTLKEVNLFANISYLETTKNNFANPKNLIYYIIHPKKLYIDFSNSSWKIGFLKKLLKIKINYQLILQLIYNKFKNNK